MRALIVLSLFFLGCTDKVVYQEEREQKEEPIDRSQEFQGDWFFVQRYQGQTYHHLYRFQDNQYEWTVYQPVNEYETKVMWSEKGMWTYGADVLMMEIEECVNPDFIGLVYAVEYEFHGQYLRLNNLLGRRSDNG